MNPVVQVHPRRPIDITARVRDIVVEHDRNRRRDDDGLGGEEGGVEESGGIGSGGGGGVMWLDIDCIIEFVKHRPRLAGVRVPMPGSVFCVCDRCDDDDDVTSGGVCDNDNDNDNARGVACSDVDIDDDGAIPMNEFVEMCLDGTVGLALPLDIIAEDDARIRFSGQMMFVCAPTSDQ
jgi:hypothetical protein